MKKADFIQAIELIMQVHTTELIINKVEPNGNVGKVLESPTISIKDCCAGLVNRLKDAGFNLSMSNGFLTVSKF